MLGGKHLLLLAASVLLARCQQKPQVSVSPSLTQIFSGDLFYLSCKDNTSGSRVKWFFKDMEQTMTNKTWKITVATPVHSGSYHCESNGQKSDSFSINVMEYIPRASLIIKTGQPVMRLNGSVILELDNDDGLQGWKCWVFRGEKTNSIKLKLKSDSVSLTFQPRSLYAPETIFWCTDRTKEQRSNQITVRTSEKPISLEMYPLPAVAGEALTLRCLAWGTDQITHTVFYKDNVVIHGSGSPTYKIHHVTDSAVGTYKCDATFTYRARTEGPHYHEVSDNQDVFVQAAPMKAVLSGNAGLSCSCPKCPSDASYRWYYMNDDEDGQPLALPDSSHGFMMPKESGTYACRAVWRTGMSFLSNSYAYKPPIKAILVIIVTVLIVIVLAVAAFYVWYKKRNTTGPIYEDVALRLQDIGEDKYETLQSPRGAEREYDTFQPEAEGREKKVGEYEALKKGEMNDSVYHTLGMEGTAGGAGGYEALKKEEMKEGVYHTLAMEGAAGGAGGYEALKKEGMKEGEYHTLAKEGTGGGEEGYEAESKDKDKEEKK